MNGRGYRIGLVIGAGALILTACGGGSDDASSSPGSGAPAATAGDRESADGDATFASAFAADDPVVIRASELAVLLVGQLGDDDTAVGAVLRAGDAGYDGLQIEAGIRAANLAADGSIAGVEPRLAAPGKITGFRRPAQGDDDDDEDLLPIERLRREAAEEAGIDDHWPSGAHGTALILSLYVQGYSQAQIVDILILGADVLDSRYEGPIAVGEDECGGFVIGGVHEIPQFCDPETGELFGDPEDQQEAQEAAGGTDPPAEAATDPPAGAATDGDGITMCNFSAFSPPYSGIPIVGSGSMLETEVLGPLNTPYYYTEVGGFLDIEADGSFTLVADTVRFADITIRGAPDNQVYKRHFDLKGVIEPKESSGLITGMIDGTDMLWSEDGENPVSGDATGELYIDCNSSAPAGFTIDGFVSGAGLLIFDAKLDGLV